MNHEKEQRHASSPSAAASQDDAVEPGQSNRSTLLCRPEHAVASGLVQRKARNANGVADGAEHAVAAASSSHGSALPEAVMRKFEHSLGADLSDVRVHTGSASQHAADAVGAKAYTVGNDIHFGAGHYDPWSARGQHLLAHEVAHTVQQSRGPQRLQAKLQVSSPGDGLEHEADVAADAMVSSGAATVSGATGLSHGILQRENSEWQNEPVPIQVSHGRVARSSHAAILAREADRWLLEYKRQRVSLLKVIVRGKAMMKSEKLGYQEMFRKHPEIGADYYRLRQATQAAWDNWQALLNETSAVADEPARLELEHYRETVKTCIELGFTAMLSIVPLVEAISEFRLAGSKVAKTSLEVGADLGKESIAGAIVDAIMPMPDSPK